MCSLMDESCGRKRTNTSSWRLMIMMMTTYQTSIRKLWESIYIFIHTHPDRFRTIELDFRFRSIIEKLSNARAAHVEYLTGRIKYSPHEILFKTFDCTSVFELQIWTGGWESIADGKFCNLSVTEIRRSD